MADQKSATPATTGQGRGGVPATSTERFNTVKALVEKNKGALLMALPKHVDVDRFSRVFFTTILKNPKLLECEPRSLVSALIQCGELGLETNPFLGLIYLVPFWNGKARKLEVQIIPGYRGYVALADRSGRVSDITAHVVYENEPFEIDYGSDEKIKHTPKPPSERGEKKIGAYVVTKLRDGRTKTTFMWTEDILKRREVSQGAWLREYNQTSKKFEYVMKNGKKVLDPKGVWAMWEDEQFEKTVIRHQARLLPLSPEYQKIQSLDVAIEADQSQRQAISFDDVEDIIDITEESAAIQGHQAEEKTEERTDSLRDRLDAANQSTQVA